MAAREILYVVQESSYGTPATATLGTNAFYLRLDQGNAWTMEAAPVDLALPYGGGYSVEAETVSDIVTVKGSFAFNLYPGVWASTLLNWAITPINSARSAPWTTTQTTTELPVGDLASLSFYHAYLEQDGTTWRRTLYSGVKCDSWRVGMTETGNGRIVTISGTCTAIRPQGNPWDSSTDPNATAFPLPAEASYPVGPYTLGMLATAGGTATIGTSGGTNRAGSLLSLNIQGTNRFAANWFTARFLQSYRFTGRQTTADATLLFNISPDDRGTFRSLTPVTGTFTLSNGTHSASFAMQTANLILPWQRQLPMDGQYLQALTLRNRWDPANTADIVFTAT